MNKGTVWGANAVNGVINVVTRSAAETQGPLPSATRSGSGGREVARWGTHLGERTQVRVYALALDRSSIRRRSSWLALAAGPNSTCRGSLRATWQP